MSKLADYIKAHYRDNVSEAARAVDIPESTVRKNSLPPSNPQFRMPRPAQMARYYLWSAGAVTPNDFYDLPPLPAGADEAASDIGPNGSQPLITSGGGAPASALGQAA